MPNNPLRDNQPDDINALLGEVTFAQPTMDELMEGYKTGMYSPRGPEARATMMRQSIPYYSTVDPSLRNMINRAVPANFRAYAGTWMGADEPITETWFTPQQLDYMGQIRGLMAMQEKMAPYEKGFEKFSRERSEIPEQGLPAWYHMPAHVLQSYQEPEVATRPFLQGGYFASSNQGPQLRNTYTVDGITRDVQVNLPRYEGPFPAHYNRRSRVNVGISD